jgi:hypothetical protein
MRCARSPRHRRRSQSGSVSVYFVAITSSLVLLTALLIDFSRIAAFRHQSELAVHAGARSVLSAYDPVMLEKYGLFVRGGDDADELLRTTLDNIGVQGRQANDFNYLEAKWTEAGIIESRPLADHGIFLRQVQEEMKYKAPIDLALELASRFRGVSAALQEASETVDLLERMRKLYESRENALDQAMQHQQATGERLLAMLGDDVPYPSVQLNGNVPAGAFHHLTDGANRYRDYWAKRQADEASEQAYFQAIAAGALVLPPLRPHAAVVAAYESSASSVAGRLGGLASRIAADAESSLALASDSIRQASAINEEMKRLVAEMHANSKVQSHQDTGETDDEPAVDRDTVVALADIRKTADQMILAETFFSGFEAELQAERMKIGGVSQLVDRSAAALASVVHAKGNDRELQTAVRQLQTALDEFASDYAPDGKVIRERRNLIGQHRSHESERRALAKEAQSEWKRWQDMLGRFGHLQGTPEERETFLHANRLAQNNLAWNGQQAEVSTASDPAVSAPANTPDEARDLAMQNAKDGLTATVDALAELRNHLYLAEYVHGRFTRMPLTQVKPLLEGGHGSLSLDRMETEYALYGFEGPSRNLAAAYGEIFAFRLAIRTMEGLVECRTAGHPLLILACTLVYGLKQAIQDIYDLMERDQVPLSRFLQLDTTYADYLRVFYLLHGRSADTVARCIAVVESDMKLDLTRAYTYVRAEGTASLKLWFFPGLLKLLNRSEQWGGIVKGNRYEATYTADFAYQ